MEPGTVQGLGASIVLAEGHAWVSSSTLLRCPRCWRDGSRVRRICCPCRGSCLSFILHTAAQKSLTPVSGDTNTLFWPPQAHSAHTWRHNTPMYKINLKHIYSRLYLVKNVSFNILVYCIRHKVPLSAQFFKVLITQVRHMELMSFRSSWVTEVLWPFYAFSAFRVFKTRSSFWLLTSSLNYFWHWRAFSGILSIPRFLARLQ